MIKKQTEAECAFKDILDRLGVDFIFQAGFLSSQTFYIVDFYIKSPYKLIIEIDDESHKERKKDIYDKQKLGYLGSCGFKVLKFTNENVLNQSRKVERQLRNCLDKLKDQNLNFKRHLPIQARMKISYAYLNLKRETEGCWRD